jgi:hypothetical protein
MAQACYKLANDCPSCQQGVTLHLLTCPGCRRVVAACDEAGCVFDPRDLTRMADSPCDLWQSTWTKCPHCRSEAEFSCSTAEEVHALGLAEADLIRSTFG